MRKKLIMIFTAVAIISLSCNQNKPLSKELKAIWHLDTIETYSKGLTNIQGSKGIPFFWHFNEYNDLVWVVKGKIDTAYAYKIMHDTLVFGDELYEIKRVDANHITISNVFSKDKEITTFHLSKTIYKSIDEISPLKKSSQTDKISSDTASSSSIANKNNQNIDNKNFQTPAGELSEAPSLIDNKYNNSSFGFSIKFDNDWKLRLQDGQPNLLFAGKAKLYAVSIAVRPITSGFKPKFSQAEADQELSEMIESLKQRNVEIDDIKMKPSYFNGKNAMIMTANMTDPREGNTMKVFERSIQVLHRGKIITIWCTLPFEVYTREIKNLDRQLATMIFF